MVFGVVKMVSRMVDGWQEAMIKSASVSVFVRRELGVGKAVGPDGWLGTHC
jgi:hypothetical protein